MIRLVSILLLALPIWAHGASPQLVRCWDGLPTTTLGSECPPEVTAPGFVEASTATSARVGATTSKTADTTHLYVKATVAGVCPDKPTFAQMLDGTGSVGHVHPGAHGAGQFSGIVTGLTDATEYCTYAMAVHDDQPSANTTNPQLYIQVSDPWTFDAPAVEGVVKWNPGHYVLITGTRQYDGEQQTARLSSNLYSQLAASQFKGVALRVPYGTLERNTRGNYAPGFAFIDAELAALAAMDPPKRLWLRMDDRFATSTSAQSEVMCSGNYTYSDAISQGAGYLRAFPAYFGLEGLVERVSDTGNCRVRWWTQDMTDAWIATVQAYGARYDSHPLFEGISITKESSMKGTGGTYNSAGLRTQWLRLAAAAYEAFPTTNVVINVNGWAGNQSDREAVIIESAALGVGHGAPDLTPQCDPVNAGDIDCTNFRDPQGDRLTATQVDSHRLAKVYVKGRAPISHSIEVAQMGNGSVGQTVGYVPDVWLRYCNEPGVGEDVTDKFGMGCNHLFWHMQCATTTSVGPVDLRIRWNGPSVDSPTSTCATSGGSASTGLWNFINAENPLLNTECPESHVARGGCLTGGVPE